MVIVTKDLLTQVNEIAALAGAAIMDIYNRPGDLKVQSKDDDSPLTEADLAAHTLICQRLRQLSPDIPILSEESKVPAFEQRLAWDRYWLIDPLDGTKEFINHNGEFTVNIALIENHQAVLGVVHVPVTRISYVGAVGLGAFKVGPTGQHQAIGVRSMSKKTGPTIVVASRRHGAEQLDRVLDLIEQVFGVYQLTSMGSSLKLCLVAEGRADVYPRIALTCEWDTAAAQAVLEAAGGVVRDPKSQPLQYNRKDSLLNPFFYAIGDAAAVGRSGKGWAELIADIE